MTRTTTYRLALSIVRKLRRMEREPHSPMMRRHYRGWRGQVIAVRALIMEAR